MILISTGVNLSCLRCDILPILPSQHAVVCDTRYAGLSSVPTYRRLYRLESGLKGKTRDLIWPPTNSHLKSSPPPSRVLNNKSSVSMLKLLNSAPCSKADPRRPPPRRKFQKANGGR